MTPETSPVADEVILNDSQIVGYKTPNTTNFKPLKGDVATFVKQNMDVTERDDLNIQTSEFEAIWLEVNNKSSKNIVIVCLYRHPHSDILDDFTNYIEMQPA